MDSCRNPQISLDEMLKWKKRADHLESELSALKSLVREMAFADYTQFTEILDRPIVRAIMEGG